MRTLLVSALVSVVALLVATDARSQSPCNPAGFMPQCSSASVLDFCDPSTNMVSSFPCTIVSAICDDVPCVGSCGTIGDACLASSGGTCYYQAPQNPALLLPCQPGLTCSRASGGESCQSWPGEMCDGDQDGFGCSGQTATWCPRDPDVGFGLAYPITTDCASFNSQCAVGQGGYAICQGSSGATCDDQALRPFSQLFCAPGYECVGATAMASGTCEPAADAGTLMDSGFVVTDGGGSIGNDDGGQTGNDGGQTGNDGGQTGTDAGQTGNDAGPTGNDAGPTGNDAGVTPTPLDGGVFGPNACGSDVGALGACEGTTLRWCQAGVVAEVDCADSERVCAELGPTVGASCVRPEDAPPIEGEEEPTSVFCLCASPGSGPPAALLLLGLLALVGGRRRR